MSNSVKTYTKKEAAGFLTGMFGQNLIYNVIATGLYFYFQNVICLPAMALGWIFAIARVWDAINDPMMGTIVDKTRSDDLYDDVLYTIELSDAGDLYKKVAPAS